MKKFIILFLMAIIVSVNLFACGGLVQTVNNNSEDVTMVESSELDYGEIDVDTVDGGEVDFDPSTIKTMGDFYKYKNGEFDNYQDGYNDTKFQMAIEINNTYYRATAYLPKDVSDKLNGIDFEQREKTIEELVLPLPVEKFENLNDLVPSHDELNIYIGKTGKELFDEGWTYMYYNVEDVSAGLCYGPFLYDVVFEYNGTPMVNTDDFDFYKEFGDLKVKSIWYTEVGDAIELE